MPISLVLFDKRWFSVQWVNCWFWRIQFDPSPNRSVIFVNNPSAACVHRLNRFAKTKSRLKRTIDSRFGHRNKATICYVFLQWEHQNSAHTVDCSDKTRTDARASWSELNFEQRNRVYDTFPKQPISCPIVCIHDY